KNFHPTISYLRGALNHGHQVAKNFILFERGAYLLNPAYLYDIDVEPFEETIRVARGNLARGEIKGAVEAYETALGLFHGPFLEEEYAEWTEIPREHLETLHAAALKEAADLRL